MTEITAIRSKPLTRELTSPLEISLGTQDRLPNVAVAVETEDGTVGIGEAAPLPPISHETQETVLAACEAAADLVSGRRLEDYRGIHETLKKLLGRQHAARAGVEMAVLDALCRQRGCSLAEFAGGRGAPVVTDDTIGLVDPATARSDANAAAEAGFEHIKIKVGGDPDADLERVRAVREGAPDVSIKVDANQGFAPKQAIRFAETVRNAGIELELLEQPVDAADISGLKRVRDAVSIPVAADETVFTAEDAAAVAAADAADIINIKIQKAGVIDALDIVRIAEAHGLELMIGVMLESYIGITTGAHLVSGTGAFSYVDLDGHFSIADPVADWTYGPEHEIEGPGLGLDVSFGDL